MQTKMQINIIYGAAGAGKTTYLRGVVKKEVEERGTKLKDIACVSFTKEGAIQIKNKVKLEFPKSKDKDYPYYGTLHSLCFHHLKFNRAMIIGRKKYKEFSEALGMHFTGYYTEDLHHNDDIYLFLYDLHRNNPKAIKDYLPIVDTKIYNFVKENFKDFKKHHALFDFTDLMQLFIEKKEILPVKVAIIDEAQDLTTLQWKMVWTAFKDCERIYIAGDDDQAIYQWSGADVDYFLGLKGDNVTILNKSWRLPKSVLWFSNNVTKMISHRVEKNVEPTDKTGQVIQVNQLDEVIITKNESWLFLSRNHYYLRQIEQWLRDKGLPFKNKDGTTIKESEVQLIKIYEHWRNTLDITPVEMTNLKLILKQDFSINQVWYDAFDWDETKIMHYRDFIKNKHTLEDWNIKVSTIHSTKGSEADNVVVLQDITKTVYENLQNNPDTEHRVFYVAITRARSNLFIVQGHDKYEYKFYK